MVKGTDFDTLLSLALGFLLLLHPVLFTICPASVSILQVRLPAARNSLLVWFEMRQILPICDSRKEGLDDPFSFVTPPLKVIEELLT